MISDLLEENQDLRKQVEELKDEIATRNGKLAILISENERLKGIVLGNEVEISDLKKSCDETQELLDKQIEATYKLDKENAELKEELKDANEKVVHLACNQNKDLKYKLTKAKEDWQKGAEFGYNKANEWHKVSEQLPTEEKDYLVKLIDGTIDVMAIALDGNLEPYLLTPKLDFYKDVEKWCEIPKESE